MTTDNEYDCAEEIAYALKRANAEGSVPLYLEKEFKNELSIDELVSDIVIMYDKATVDELEGFTGSSNVDMFEYIAKETGYSFEIIELVAWFYDCCLMDDGRSTMHGACPKCGHDVLYIREDKDQMFGSYIECGKCMTCFNFEEFEEYRKDGKSNDDSNY